MTLSTGKSGSPPGVRLGTVKTGDWRGKHLREFYQFYHRGCGHGTRFWSFVKGLFLSKSVAKRSLKRKTHKKEKTAEKEDEDYFKIFKVFLNESKSLLSVG